MAATNEVVADKEGEIVYWVYAVVIVLVWLSFRSVAPWCASYCLSPWCRCSATP